MIRVGLVGPAAVGALGTWSTGSVLQGHWVAVWGGGHSCTRRLSLQPLLCGGGLGVLPPPAALVCVQAVLVRWWEKGIKEARGQGQNKSAYIQKRGKFIPLIDRISAALPLTAPCKHGAPRAEEQNPHKCKAPLERTQTTC